MAAGVRGRLWVNSWVASATTFVLQGLNPAQWLRERQEAVSWGRPSRLPAKRAADWAPRPRAVWGSARRQCRGCCSARARGSWPCH